MQQGPLRSHTDARQATEVVIAVRALNCMLELGPRNPSASHRQRQPTGSLCRSHDPCNTVHARHSPLTLHDLQVDY